MSAAEGITEQKEGSGAMAQHCLNTTTPTGGVSHRALSSKCVSFIFLALVLF